MLKRSYIYLILTVVALLAAACSKAPELTEPSVPVPDMTNVIKFDMLETKVTNDDIKDQEFIIYDYVDGVQYIDGSKYTLKYSEDEDAWRFYDNDDPETAVDFYWTETGTHEFFAYNKVNYYWSDGSFDSYKVSLNFDYSEKWLKPSSYIRLLYPTSSPDARGLYQDLICATTTRNVSEDGYGPVEIRFNHMFASVKFTFQNNSLTDKTISNLSITNLYHSTGFDTRLYFDRSYTPDFESAGTYEFPISATVQNGEAWDAFGTVIVLPQALGGMTEEVVWHEDGVEKSLYIYNDLGTDYWYAGKLYHYVITLNPTPLILAPTATIEHTEDAGGDKFSVVNVNLNAPAEELPRITDLVITVTDSEGPVCETNVADADVSNEIRLVCDKLLPPGTYTVYVDYHDGVSSQRVSTTAVSAVQPALGYYVNIDGTFSETFISSSSNASGYSIAKIFYTEDPTEEDTQLKADYSYCTHGLAYEVDGSGSIVDNRNWDNAKTSWNTTTTQKQNAPSIIKDNSSAYTSVDNIHGYSNTVAIKSMYNYGFISAVDTSSPCVPGVTSPWYIASLGELKKIKEQTSFTTSNSYYIWPSTIEGENAWSGGVYGFAYMWSIYWNDTTGTITSANAYGSYAKHGYVRILAF